MKTPNQSPTRTGTRRRTSRRHLDLSESPPDAADHSFATMDRFAPRITWRNPGDLIPNDGNARTHSDKQIAQIAASIDQFGFVTPIVIGPNEQILAGHGRVAAAKLLGLSQIPVIRIDHLTEAERRAYVIADNHLAELAGWDRELLAVELQELSNIDLGFDIEVAGFETAEIDLLIEELGTEAPDEAAPLPPPAANTPQVTQLGDLWHLGNHRLICGDALDPVIFQRLMGEEEAHAVVTDPPYNVQIGGHVGGSGRIQHREFAMAAGEMSEAEFTAFLRQILINLARHCIDGAVLFIFMDWRHLYELQTAARHAGLAILNLCVWAKTNAGMGSLYRSQHELVVVLKKGTAPHVNNIQLGRYGRYRTNLWTYEGANSIRPSRRAELALHPTVKPVALVADAIKDVTRRGDLVLDSFAGSGTTILAAEKTGRRCYAAELDPIYIDVAVRRWQTLTGRQAVHADYGMTFDQLAENRPTTVRRIRKRRKPVEV